MATMCPKCKNGVMKKGEKMVYCAEYKPTKNGDNWVNEGTCEFRILFDQKTVFGKIIEAKDIKTLIDGGTLINGARKMKLDLDSQYFTKVEKEEDEDL